jgi:7-carboxy-7-deazaguanine synthase
MNNVRIKEIFESIQGEGPYVGYKQLFVRFCNCNLKCNYCDTEFSSESGYKEYNHCELAEVVNSYKSVHSVSLTGGEPLLAADFLKDFLPLVNKKIYLETNATLADKLLIVKPFIDIVSADIKLESATGIKDSYRFHDKFFENCKGIETFAKIVFNKMITDDEIQNSCNLAKKYGIELILQPEMVQDKMSVSSEFAASILDKFLDRYENVRLIPQVHKFLDVR